MRAAVKGDLRVQERCLVVQGVAALGVQGSRVLRG